MSRIYSTLQTMSGQERNSCLWKRWMISVCLVKIETQLDMSSLPSMQKLLSMSKNLVWFGIDVHQTRHYIKIYNKTYIEKILKNHPWLHQEKPAADFPLPMWADNDYIRTLEEAEPFTEDERVQHKATVGFSYRQAIGEIIYALVTCRPDISFAAIKLS